MPPCKKAAVRIIFVMPMLRGQKALMTIVSNDTTIASEKHVKGCFTDGRDDALACRFYYYGHPRCP